MKKLLIAFGLVFALSLTSVHAQTTANNAAAIANLQQIIAGLVQQLNQLRASQVLGGQSSSVPVSTPVTIVSTISGLQDWCSLLARNELAMRKEKDGAYPDAKYLGDKENFYSAACTNPPKTQNQSDILNLQSELIDVRWNYLLGPKTFISGTVVNQKMQTIQQQISDLQQLGN